MTPSLGKEKKKLLIPLNCPPTHMHLSYSKVILEFYVYHFKIFPHIFYHIAYFGLFLLLF